LTYQKKCSFLYISKIKVYFYGIFILMIFGEKTRVEEHLIELLDKGALDGPTIISHLKSSYSPTVTKQAIYQALRKLTKEEVVNKSGSTYSLNRVWLKKIKTFAERHIDTVTNTNFRNILGFEDGDSVTYKFKNPFLLDITWGHLYDIVFEANDKHWVMLNHHPHEWLILSRTETEKFWLNQIEEQRKMMLFTINGNTELDKEFKKEWSSNYIKINTGESYGLKPNQYLSVVGDYVFEITTDMQFEEKVHEFFMQNEIIDQAAQEEIRDISQQKYASKIKVQKSRKKANGWRKKYKMDFYIPKPYYNFPE